jgi:hypothetical protein
MEVMIKGMETDESYIPIPILSTLAAYLVTSHCITSVQILQISSIHFTATASILCYLPLGMRPGERVKWKNGVILSFPPKHPGPQLVLATSSLQASMAL